MTIWCNIFRFQLLPIQPKSWSEMNIWGTVREIRLGFKFPEWSCNSTPNGFLMILPFLTGHRVIATSESRETHEKISDHLTQGVE